MASLLFMVKLRNYLAMELFLFLRFANLIEKITLKMCFILTASLHHERNDCISIGTRVDCITRGVLCFH